MNTAYVWSKPRGWGDGGGTELLVAGDLLAAVDAWAKGELTDRKGQPLGGGPLAAIGLHPWLLAPELAPPEHQRQMLSRHRELAPELQDLEARGIRVRGEGGVLAWEIRLYPPEDGTQPSPEYVTPETISGSAPFQTNVKGNTLPEGDFPPPGGGRSAWR